MINLLLGSYQKKLGEKLGVIPGAELLEATKVAKEKEIPIELCDRDIRVTLRRAWNSMSFWEKFKLISSGLAGIYKKQEISEEKLAELKKKDVLTELMSELGQAMPVLKKVLIDERDNYLAQKIRDSKGEKIVAVVGAGHVNGININLNEENKFNLEEIEKIPFSSSILKWIGWGVPAIIIASLVYIGFSKGAGEAGDNVIFWILANGIPCALGAVVALAHPITVFASFLAAPITSLTPVIGAGYVAAFVQVYVHPPIVKEFQTVIEDAGHLKKWWGNKLLRVFLVFLFTGLGSLLGTYVGLYEIISNLF